MRLKPCTVFALFAFLLFGCDKVDKPVSSVASHTAPIADASSVIIAPNRGVEVPLIFDGSVYAPPEQSKSACTTVAQKGNLTVTCRILADTHLVSAPVELTAGQIYKLSGQVKGSELASSNEPNAAGIALLGERMLVDFPSGSYDWRGIEISFTVPSTDSRKFSVGVGGWKQGKGKLEVKELKLYK